MVVLHIFFRLIADVIAELCFFFQGRGYDEWLCWSDFRVTRLFQDVPFVF